MGIYIKGMEMPQKKYGYVLVIYPDGKVYCQDGEEYTAFPVPPHGRLIDADALIEDLKYDVELDAVALDSIEIVGDKRRMLQDDKDFKQYCIFGIENVPTIIPAEKG